MADDTPVKQSPIHFEALKMGARFSEGAGWEIPTLFGTAESEQTAVQNHVGLADVSDRGKIFVEGQTAESILSLDGSLTVGEGQLQGGLAIFKLRADQFFVSTPGGSAESVTAELAAEAEKAAALITVTDLTHGRSQLLVVGPKSAELLGRLCGLDFHESQFPDRSARQSSVAKSRQLILRLDMDGLPAYHLIGSRSLAAYLWRTVLEAGRDLSIGPVGSETVGSLE